MVAVFVFVILLSRGLQVVDGMTYPDSLIVSLLVANVLLLLQVLRKRAHSENSSPGS